MSSFDLEEQEQIANLKAFWDKYGNFILTVVTLVLSLFAAKNGWEWWQRREAAQAVVAYEQLEKAVTDKNLAALKDASSSLLENNKRTTYAQMGALMAAKAFYDAGDARSAKAQLQWVIDQGSDKAYVAAARIRLAGVLLDEKQADEALKVLNAEVPKPFEPLLADRRGDVFVAQGKADDAKKAYETALAGLQNNAEWKAVVQMKLDALAQ